MADSWGRAGPPKEAYSRVSRHLAEVTAGFGAYLDGLPPSLLARFDCRVREVTSAEAERLGIDGSVEAAYAVEPSSPESSTLLVGRATEDGAVTATLAFGLAQTTLLPDCLCDACDEDSESLVEQAEEFVAAAVQGCREFRGPYRPRPGTALLGPTWLEEGCETATGAWSRASGQLSGEPFERRWTPWDARPHE